MVTSPPGQVSEAMGAPPVPELDDEEDVEELVVEVLVDEVLVEEEVVEPPDPPESPQAATIPKPRAGTHSAQTHVLACIMSS